MGWGYDYAPYVPLAQRRAEAAKALARLLKKKQTATPVKIPGRTIATTFWGKAWCTNLEGYSDFANRLPRGRTYARNGSIVHLAMEQGKITAAVSGSELYEIEISIAVLSNSDWQAIKKKCAGRIGSLIELLQGKLSQEVMEQVTERQGGLFPRPKDIRMECSCPDFAGMCKHLAAVMYGIGHRLDSSPELLFLLRGVDHTELIEQALPAAPAKSKRTVPTLATADLGAIFDIELAETPAAQSRARPRKTRTPDAAAGQAAASKPTASRKPPAPAARITTAARKTTAVAKTAASATPPAAVKTPAAKTPAEKTPIAKTKAPVARKPQAVAKATAATKAVTSAKAKPAAKAKTAAQTKAAGKTKLATNAKATRTRKPA